MRCKCTRCIRCAANKMFLLSINLLFFLSFKAITDNTKLKGSKVHLLNDFFHLLHKYLLIWAYFKVQIDRFNLPFQKIDGCNCTCCTRYNSNLAIQPSKYLTKYLLIYFDNLSTLKCQIKSNFQGNITSKRTQNTWFFPKNTNLGDYLGYTIIKINGTPVQTFDEAGDAKYANINKLDVVFTLENIKYSASRRNTGNPSGYQGRTWLEKRLAWLEKKQTQVCICLGVFVVIAVGIAFGILLWQDF